jgi:hypothetical protein
MYQRHFKSILGARRMKRGLKYLEKGKNGEGIGVTDSWGVESTIEPKDSTEESRNRQWRSWGGGSLTIILERKRMKEGEGVTSCSG